MKERVEKLLWRCVPRSDAVLLAAFLLAFVTALLWDVRGLTLLWEAQGPGVVFDVWTKTNLSAPWQPLAVGLTNNSLPLATNAPMRFYMVSARWPEHSPTPPP